MERKPRVRFDQRSCRYVAVIGVAIALKYAFADSPSFGDESSKLSTATIFKLGMVGIAAHTSEEEMALAKVLKATDAEARLLEILKSARSNEGKLYALCGLRNLSRSRYEKAVATATWTGPDFNAMTADVIVKTLIAAQLDRMRREGCAVQGVSG